jgi:NADPH:quinone reductase-like Zn-dependent oxidoreductase
VVADVPGLEVAGTIDALGPGAEGRVGERVMTLVPGGGYAEAVVAHGREVLAVPEAWSWEEAAAAPESYLTAFDALFERGGARPGERVLVHAIGSGVGLATLQLARAAGLVVAGTSRTRAKLDRAVAMGLDCAVLVDGAAPVGLPEVDLVVDLVGGRWTAASLGALAPRGRLVLVGLLAGATAELPLALLLARRLRVEGTVLRSRPLEEKIALAQAFRARGLRLLGVGGLLGAGGPPALRPVVDAVFPAEEAAEAHRRMESNASFGRIVLRW